MSWLVPNRTWRSRPALVPTFIFLAFISAPSHARWYQVEVVAFENTATMDGIQEQWPALGSLLDLSDAVILSSPTSNTSKSELKEETKQTDTDSPTPFIAITLEEMGLSDVVESLEQSDDYKTLLYAGWRQPGYGVKKPKRVYLIETSPISNEDALEAENHKLGTVAVEGLVGIKVAKLLHVEVDFIFYHDGRPVRLKERRKVRLRETHYFDHPLFSLIVRVSPHELEAPTL